MMRNEIEVVTAEGKTDAGTVVHQSTIVDRKANRCWSGSGSTMAEAHTEATRKFIGDRRAREYVGEP